MKQTLHSKITRNIVKLPTSFTFVSIGNCRRNGIHTVLSMKVLLIQCLDVKFACSVLSIDIVLVQYDIISNEKAISKIVASAFICAMRQQLRSQDLAPGYFHFVI